MGKPKTRHLSAVWFEPSVELPDCGDLYTLRDVLAACSKELEVSPQSTPHHIAAKIEAQVRGQWMECNPQLVLHTQEVATLKIIRAMEKSNCIKNNKGITTKQKKLFLRRSTSYLIYLFVNASLSTVMIFIVLTMNVKRYILTVIVKENLRFLKWSCNLSETKERKLDCTVK